MRLFETYMVEEIYFKFNIQPLAGKLSECFQEACPCLEKLKTCESFIHRERSSVTRMRWLDNSNVVFFH